MNNAKMESTDSNSEISLWELLNLLLKKKALIIIIVIVTLLMGGFYSFVIQEQGTVSYTIAQVVLYDEWEYYPPSTAQNYTTALKTYISESVNENHIASVSIKDSNSKDNRMDYKLTVAFLPGTSEAQIETISAMIIAWHNEMIVTETNRILANKENEQNLLYLDYATTAQEYAEYMSQKPESIKTVTPEEEILNSSKEIAFELWKENTVAIKEMEYRFIDAPFYYIDNFTTSSITVDTWKTNIMLSVISGFLLAIIYILLRESYLNYKKAKEQI